MIGTGIALNLGGKLMMAHAHNRLSNKTTPVINSRLSHRLVQDSNKKLGRELYITGSKEYKGINAGYLTGDDIRDYIEWDPKVKLSKRDEAKLDKGDLVVVSDELYPEVPNPLRHKVSNHMKVLNKLDATILSHELGHRELEWDGNRKSILSRNAIPSRVARMINASPISAATSFTSGYIDGKRKALGKRSIIRTKVAPIATTILPQASELLDEYGASKRGLRNMRKLGASEEELSNARKTLNRAFRTYAGDSIRAVGTNLALYGAGRALGKFNNTKLSLIERIK